MDPKQLKTPKEPKQSKQSEKKTKVKVSCLLTLDHTTKLQFPKYCAGTETDTESNVIDLNAYPQSQLTYNKRSKSIQQEKDSFFNKQCWEVGQLHVKEVRTFFTPYKKISSKCIKDQNINS